MNSNPDQSDTVPLPAMPPAAPHPTDAAPPATDRIATTLASSHSAEPTQSSQMAEDILQQAKQVMAQPNANPYHQSQALQQLKARYVYARYNINLKITQD